MLEALAGKETEFVRTPKHGIGTSDKSWWSKKYHAAKSVTPFLELAMAAYFVIAIAVAIDHGHYMSLPFLGLFLCGFGYVGCVSLWQGSAGASLRRAVSLLTGNRGTVVVPPPAHPVMNARRKAVTGEIVLADAPVPPRPRNLRLISPSPACGRGPGRGQALRAATLARERGGVRASLASGNARAREGVRASAGQACAARNAR